ncbi:MAG: kynureninase [Usitatibacteraceae bacterium]
MKEARKMALDRSHCEALDAADPLRDLRERFDVPSETIYLDGNSLGALPRTTAKRMEDVIREEWGRGLIRSWNQHAWITLPQRVGAKLAHLLGARADEVVVADSTSINIFKLLAGALATPGAKGRRVILSERGNFPTDLYIAEGLNTLLGEKYVLKLVDGKGVVAALDNDVAVALITQVDYCSGRLHDMAQLNARAKESGARIIWDLSHSAGALPIDLNAHGAELAVGCGYKYLNGGPGAPAFAYVAKPLQATFATPLAGWFGHRNPFSFSDSYSPAPGIERLLCGTPSVLATAALECGIDTFAGTSREAIRNKSLALSSLFRSATDQEWGGLGFSCITPIEPAARGSQLSFAHEHAYAIMQAIIDRGVIGDFRQPNLMRFGFTPLYTRFVDCWDAVASTRDVMRNGAWKADKYHLRNRVT